MEPINYDLDARAIAMWKRLLPSVWNRHGFKTKLAKAICAELSLGNEASMGVWLTNFGMGHAKGLKPILGDQDKARIVARELGLRDADELRDLLRRAQETGVTVGMFEVLVPGFEEFGPVPVDEIFVAPPSSMTWTLPRGETVDTMSRTADLYANFARNAAENPRRAYRFAVSGPQGSGRTTWLKHFAVHCERAGGRVFPWSVSSLPPRTAGSRLVAVCDDTEAWSEGNWQALHRWLEAESGVALVSWDGEGNPPPGPTYGIVFSLGLARDSDVALRVESAAAGPPTSRVHRPVGREVVAQHLRRLADVAARRWKRSVDPEPVLRWFDANPSADRLLGQPAGLYHLARMANDGFAPAPASLMGPLARRCALRANDSFPDSAQFLETLGESFATQLADRHAGEATREQVAALVIDMIDKRGMRPRAAEWKPSSAFSIVDGLLEGGFLRKGAGDPKTLTFAFGLQRIVALASAFSTQDPDYCEARGALMVSSEDGADALMIVASNQGDLKEVINWIRALPAEARAQSALALTRLLASGVPCRDRGAVVWAFRFASTWNFAFGPPTYPWRLPSPIPQGRERELRVGGRLPVALLGRASCLHRRWLKGADLSLLRLDEAPELHDFAALMGRAAEAPESLAILLTLATCGFSEGLDAQMWRRLTLRDRSDSEPAVMPMHLFAEWWMLVSSDYLSARGESADILLAGTGTLELTADEADSFDRATGAVLAAITRRLTAGDARAPRRFAMLLVHALETGSTVQRRHLREGWGRATRTQRDEIADEVVSLMSGVLPTSWLRVPDARDPEWFDGLRADRIWCLKEVLEPARALQLVQAWCASSPPELPWSEVLDALPDGEQLLVDWIGGALPDDRLAHEWPFLDRVAQDGARDPDGWRREAPRDVRTAVGWVCCFGRSETLEFLMKALNDSRQFSFWASAAEQELRQRDPKRWRLVCIEQTLSEPPRFGRITLKSFRPQLGESALWRAVLVREPCPVWQFVHRVQVAVASGDGAAEDWAAAVASIPSSEQRFQYFNDHHGEGTPYIAVGEALFYGAEWAPSGIRLVIEAILVSEGCQDFVWEPFVAAVQRVLGPEQAVAWLESYLAGDPTRSSERLMGWAFGCWDGIEVARIALTRPRLRGAAATAIASRLLPSRGVTAVDLLDAALRGEAGVALEGASGPLIVLLEAAARRAPEPTIAWLERHPEVATPPVWRALVPQLPPGPLRARALIGVQGAFARK